MLNVITLEGFLVLHKNPYKCSALFKKQYLTGFKIGHYYHIGTTV